MTREELLDIINDDKLFGPVTPDMAHILLDLLDMPPREERRDSTQALFSYAEGYNAALAAVKERIEKG